MVNTHDWSRAVQLSNSAFISITEAYHGIVTEYVRELARSPSTSQSGGTEAKEKGQSVALRRVGWFIWSISSVCLVPPCVCMFAYLLTVYIVKMVRAAGIESRFRKKHRPYYD
jgi:hypothetical protein